MCNSQPAGRLSRGIWTDFIHLQGQCDLLGNAPTSAGRMSCGSGLAWETLPGGDEGASGHAVLFQPGQSLEHLSLFRLPYGPRHNSSILTISTMQFTFFSVFCKPLDFQPNSAAPSSAQSLLQHPCYLRKLFVLFQWYLGPGTAVPCKIKLSLGHSLQSQVACGRDEPDL